jgi:hypothetical protein
MNKEIKEKFITLWDRFFGGPELPITFYYTNDPDRAEYAPSPKGHRCIIGDLESVRKGNSQLFDINNLGCPGSKRYLGYTNTLAPNFEFFLSCGIPGQLEGERYKKNPDLVKKFLQKHTFFEAPAQYIVFKRWDALDESDNPDAVIFFARPDVIAGLFTLANFDSSEFSQVITPFGSGCMMTVMFPYLECQKDEPRAILGMNDPSARPFVQEDVFTIAMPVKKLLKMTDYMEESFLITPSWEKILRRMKKKT